MLYIYYIYIYINLHSISKIEIVYSIVHKNMGILILFLTNNIKKKKQIINKDIK